MYKMFFLIIGGLMAACTVPKSDAQPSKNYSEAQRPQFHFSPEKMWMNDPNGMVYYQGEYHLFYQYYPGSTVWGPMHWGHAVSKDLVHWEHLPIALYPDSLGLIFSGSAVVDWKNTSGFGLASGEKQPPLVAMFTQHDMAGEKAGKKDFQCQSLAYSNDRGRSWTKYAGNPVIPNPGIRDFRDTKVFWHEATQRWVVIFAAGDQVLFYESVTTKAVVGLAEITRHAFPDTTTAEPGWVAVELKPLRSLPRPVALAEIKAEPALATIALLRQSRLSVLPLARAEFALIVKLGAAQPG